MPYVFQPLVLAAVLAALACGNTIMNVSSAPARVGPSHYSCSQDVCVETANHDVWKVILSPNPRLWTVIFGARGVAAVVVAIVVAYIRGCVATAREFSTSSNVRNRQSCWGERVAITKKVLGFYFFARGGKTMTSPGRYLYGEPSVSSSLTAGQPGFKTETWTADVPV